MKSALIVTCLTLLRLGVPLVTMLMIGEAVRRHGQKTHRVGGA
jgi:hypothetical protein